jgi:hypothetical protein
MQVPLMLSAITAPSDALQVTYGQAQQFVPCTHSASNPSGSISICLKPKSASSDSELHVQALHELINTELIKSTRLRALVVMKKPSLS